MHDGRITPTDDSHPRIPLIVYRRGSGFWLRARISPTDVIPRDERCFRLPADFVPELLNTHMSRIVSRAIDTAIEKMSALPPEEQDRIAQWLLGELQDEERWTQAFSSSQHALSRLADEARSDIRAGRATQLDPDKL